MSTYTTNTNPREREVNRTQTPEGLDKGSTKGGANFRNFQNPLSKANLENRNTSYSGYDRFK